MKKKIIIFTLLFCSLILLSGYEKNNIYKASKNVNKEVTNVYKINNLKVNNQSYKGKGVKIGILDTGIDYTHQDLNIKGGVSILDEKDSYIDENGHGTNVAGVIGAMNDNNLTGIASDAQLYAIKVINKNGEGKEENIIQGVKWAVDHKMDILNMSIGTKIYSKNIEDVIRQAENAGILIVAPAGNSGYSTKSNLSYPAKFNDVIAVGSVNKYFKRSIFSSVGSELDIMATGENILTTSLNNKYTYESGTSIAAPYVTGAAAILLSIDHNLTNKDLKIILKVSATKLGEKHQYGSGLLDIKRAIEFVQLKKTNEQLYNLLTDKNYIFLESLKK
ncbi:S8 family peptidase (plasmid) [Priestia flexa]|uniref:S8 family peptidase n=1 Tax=Priestia flexa TaxID=86664 RepID=UPI00240DA352|nr:S8 family peptidase [Priestia flexa]WEZ10353.1 S8 family peptidase [Priestia flexa]